jgi:ATP-dependent RNA helicase DeaD
MNKLKFDELQLSRTLQKAITDMGFEEATPIQSETIPLLFEGLDVVGQAQTGTGKTAAFAIPIIEKIDMSLKEIQAIVLSPTRELAIQVTEEFRKLLKYKDEITAISVYGGQDINRQFKALRKGPQILVGTPGRTIDHLNRGSVKFDKVKVVVLDEADEMLDMGFRDDIEFILGSASKERQTVMFSATMPKEFLALTKKYQKDPKFVDVTYHKMSVPKIEQIYFEISGKSKPEALARLLDLHDIKLALVFCNTKNQVDLLVDLLKNRGYLAEGLHGDLTQPKRDKVMQSFRNGTVEVLVATDVAGRGIDVNNVEAVFNYDLPYDDEDYIHRIGRTGRAGKTGKAFTFVVGKEIYNLKRIERTYNIKVISQQIPSVDDLEETKLQLYIDKIKSTIEEGHLHKFILNIEKLTQEDITSLDVAAALLKIIIAGEFEKFEKATNFKDTFRGDDDDRRRSGGRDRGGRGGRDRDRGRGSRDRDHGARGGRDRRDGDGRDRDRDRGGKSRSKSERFGEKKHEDGRDRSEFRFGSDRESIKPKETPNWRELTDDFTGLDVAKSHKRHEKKHDKPGKKKKNKE